MAVVVASSGGGGGSKSSSVSSSTTKGSAPAPAGVPFKTGLKPVPTNHVTGSGNTAISLNGDVATVTSTPTGC